MKKKYTNYYILILILLITIIAYSIIKKTNTNKIQLQNNNQEIVYTYYNKNDKIIPAINIKNIDSTINSSINEFVNPYINNNQININYKYNISGNILSLIIIVSNYSNEGAPDYKFKTININIKKLKELNNEEILELYSLKKENIEELLNNNFTNYYKEEINKKKIKNNITYKEYLLSHDINDLYNQSYLYINNSKLEIFLDFKEFSSIETEYYFNDIGHIFKYD